VSPALSSPSYESTPSFPADPDALLFAASNSQLEPASLLAHAEQQFLASGDGRYLLAPALNCWQHKKDTEAHALLVRAAPTCSFNSTYYQLRGMVSRRLVGGPYFAEAKRCYELTIKIDPSRPDAYYNLGNLIHDDHFYEAERAFILSLELNAEAATVWHNLGRVFTDTDRHELSVKSLQCSLQLDPSVADVWCNLGLAWHGYGHFDKAKRCLEFSIGLDRLHVPSHINMGNALLGLLQPDAAIQFLERGVELEQSSSNSLWNLSLAYLLLGDYQRGWQYYEARFATKQFDLVTRPTIGTVPATLADCPSPTDPPLVVWTEQGIGDAIQFSRYLLLLKANSIPFVFFTRPSLLDLFSLWLGLGDLVFSDENLHPNQDHRPNIALMSLPKLFGTTLATIPSVTPYLKAPASPPTNLIVTPPPGGISIGIVWASNPSNKAMYRHKSFPIALLLPKLISLLEIDLVEIHSLQVGSEANQLNPWLHHEKLFDWNHKLTNFSDTAYIVSQLDLVISVDTAVAHMAGALNIPTWLLLPYNSDFRWLRNTDRSPWYDSIRIFRQNQRGDWPDVINQVSEALNLLFLLDIDKLSKSAVNNVIHHG